MKQLLMLMVFVALALASSPVFAEDNTIEIDISDCYQGNNCFSVIIHTFNPEEKVKVQAWFDIYHWTGEKEPDFYPLFNVYNYFEKPITPEIGMQLLDEKGTVLIEIKDKREFQPTTKTEPSYETYVSLGAKPLTKKELEEARFVRMLYNNNHAFGER